MALRNFSAGFVMIACTACENRPSEGEGAVTAPTEDGSSAATEPGSSERPSPDLTSPGATVPNEPPPQETGAPSPSEPALTTTPSSATGGNSGAPGSTPVGGSPGGLGTGGADEDSAAAASGGPPVGGTGGSAGEAAGGDASADAGIETGGTPSDDPKSKFHVFLLLGQSNMEGQPQPEAQDREEHPRVQVLAYDNCPTLGREYGQWYPASPPLHSCGGGVGPGDYFAKTLIESLPQDASIGLVPCAVNGAPIDLFLEDVPRSGYYLPPDDHWETGYEWIVTRARQAQEVGTIRGILFHQGESNPDQPDWVDKVADLVGDLREDLGLGEVPFLAGELYHDGCCPTHNALIGELRSAITNAHVVSAEGLGGYDIYHFDLAAQREFGRRYGGKMIEVLTLP